MEQLAQKGAGGKFGMAQKLRTRLWVERGLFLALAAAAALYYALVLRAPREACVISVAGKPAVVVESQAAADRLLREMKRAAGPIPNVAFAEPVTFQRIAAKGASVVSEEEAVKRLSSRLTLVTPGVGIFVEDTLLFGFAERSQAVRTISSLLAELSPPGENVTRTFATPVRVGAARIPVGKFLPSAAAALAQVRESLAQKKRHTVRPGDSPWRISQDYGITIDRLRQANPSVDFGRLRAGDIVMVPTGLSPITVVAWKEVEEPIAGDTFRVVRVKYVNGVETERQVIQRPQHPRAARASGRRSTRRRLSAPADPGRPEATEQLER